MSASEISYTHPASQGVPPVMHQTWSQLLFMHWPVPVRFLRPRIPLRLKIDTFDGAAWIGMTPFAMSGIRPHGFPSPPLAGRSLELNVRTYVRLDDIPGVWFLSLDAQNTLAVVGARLMYHLPYYQARMRLQRNGEILHFASRRTHPGAPEAHLKVSWRRRGSSRTAQPDTLDAFLVERYCLFTEHAGGIYRAFIRHSPWSLQDVNSFCLHSTLLESHGLAVNGPPLLHALRDTLEVEVWRPEKCCLSEG